MNKYVLSQLKDSRLNDAEESDAKNGININGANSVPGTVGSRGTGKKIIMVFVSILAAAVPVAVYLFGAANEKAPVETAPGEKVLVEKADQSLRDNMSNELQVERAFIEQEKQRLAEQRRNLKNFESELDKRYSDYVRRAQQLADNEIAFNNKVELRTVDRQAVDTYESIDPEQAAVLLRDLYKKDSALAILIIRRISGKRAGRILEYMIPIDKETAAKIAQDALNYYRPK